MDTEFGVSRVPREIRFTGKPHPQQSEAVGYFTPDSEMHVDTPDFAGIKEVYVFRVISPCFLLFDFWLSHFYSATIDVSMTFLSLSYHEKVHFPDQYP